MEKIKYIVDEFFNPFNGKNSDEVWAKIKANKKPVDKHQILEEMKQELMKRKGLILNNKLK